MFSVQNDVLIINPKDLLDYLNSVPEDRTFNMRFNGECLFDAYLNSEECYKEASIGIRRVKLKTYQDAYIVVDIQPWITDFMASHWGIYTAKHLKHDLQSLMRMS